MPPPKAVINEYVLRFICEILAACERTPLQQHSPLRWSPEILDHIAQHVEKLPSAKKHWMSCGINPSNLSPSLSTLQEATGEEEEEEDGDDDSGSDASVEETLKESHVDCDRPPVQRLECAVPPVLLVNRQFLSSSSLSNPPQRNTISRIVLLHTIRAPNPPRSPLSGLVPLRIVLMPALFTTASSLPVLNSRELSSCQPC